MSIKEVLASLKTRLTGRAPASGIWMSDTGTIVTEDTAMRQAAVNACVRVLSEDVAALPLRLYRRTADGGKERAVDHPLYEMLMARPNSDMTAIAYRQAVMVNLLLAGMGYSFIEYDRSGRVSALWPLVTTDVERYRDDYGVLRYRCSGELVPAEYIMPVVGLSYDGITGLSPIGYAREAIGTDIAAEKYGSKFFKTGVSLSGVITTDKPVMSDEAYNRTVNQFREMFAGLERAHGVAFLEDGTKYTPIGINPQDAQFIETRKFQREQIAAIYRVPPHLIGDLEHATFSNIEHQSIEYLQRALLPWLKRIEQAANTSLLTAEERKTLFFEHDTSEFLRGDLVTRSSALQQQILSGQITINEARSIENRNPLDGLDVTLLPLNMAMVDKNGRVVGVTGSEEPDTRSKWDFLSGGDRRPALRSWDRRDAGIDPLKVAPAKREKAAKAMEALIQEIIDGVEKIFDWYFDNQRGDFSDGSEYRAKPRNVITLTKMLNSFMDEVYEDGLNALDEDIKAGEMGEKWRSLDEAIDDIAHDAFEGIHKEMGPDGACITEAWVNEFLRKYHAGTLDRVHQASFTEVTSLLKTLDEAGDLDARKAIQGAIGNWRNPKGNDSRLLAKDEITTATNEARRAAYLSGGHTSKWNSAGSENCPACRRLNGREVTTLMPPLHSGCVCYLSMGGKLPKKDKYDTMLTEDMLRHAWHGDWSVNSGRLIGGGHGQACLDKLMEMSKGRTPAQGLLYDAGSKKDGTIKANGVRFGWIKEAKQSYKRKPGGMAWFPDHWTDEDIRAAGKAALMYGEKVDSNSGSAVELVYLGVNVRVNIDGNGNVLTICPSFDQDIDTATGKVRRKK